MVAKNFADLNKVPSLVAGRVEGIRYRLPPPIRNRACTFGRTRLLSVLLIVITGLLT